MQTLNILDSFSVCGTLKKDNLFSKMYKHMCKKTDASMQALFSSSGAETLPQPVWGSKTHLETFWNEKGLDVERTLGTVGEAFKTLSECKSLFYDSMHHVSSSVNELPHCRTIDWLHEEFQKKTNHETVLCHPSEVTRNHPKPNRLGYVIERAGFSGLQREVIESLDQRLIVLRYHDRIISAYLAVVIRIDAQNYAPCE
jgi:hypothetical protein